MRMRSACLALLLWPALLWGQQVTLPPEVKGEPGAFVMVAAKTDCPSLQWFTCDDSLQVFPPHLLRDTLTAVVVARKPGRYTLYAYGAKGDTPTPPAKTVLVIGDAPDPGPGPDPGPVDPLTKTFQAAYDADVSISKHATLPLLIGVMEAAAAQADLAQTTGHLNSAVSALRQQKIGDALAGIRAEIGKHLNATLPTADIPLTAELRAKVKGEYARVATALKGVKAS